MVNTKDSSEGRVLSAIGYLWILCLLPLMIHRDNAFSQFHGKQGLVLFIFWMVTWLVFSILILIFGHLPIIGWLLFGILRLVQFLLYIVYLVLMVIGIIKAASGVYWRMPVLGAYAEKLKI